MTQVTLAKKRKTTTPKCVSFRFISCIHTKLNFLAFDYAKDNGLPKNDTSESVDIKNDT